MQKLIISFALIAVVSAQYAAWPAQSYSPYYQSLFAAAQTPVASVAAAPVAAPVLPQAAPVAPIAAAPVVAAAPQPPSSAPQFPSSQLLPCSFAAPMVAPAAILAKH
ncbi:hypothetical protein PRIPAC_73242 [Pristionchus pacificus]|uniref:Uncharacterized protein n=1 Tax=Pristionchus pacificus TaxID=54126 RepID=A0A2A6CGA0_PRIPA|nr:hypothetical protein PRIPAC_73242 [Pristionchus pacificus]|eukprot:PDM77242.1 hypothetical protein PRIPAC_43154 [Pristionchus pacificus]